MFTPGIEKVNYIEAGKTAMHNIASLRAMDATKKHPIVKEIPKQCPGEKFSLKCTPQSTWMRYNDFSG